jgi:hypothetical protein
MPTEPPKPTAKPPEPPKPTPSSQNANSKVPDPKPTPIIAKPSNSTAMPCAIVFLTGPYKGQTLDLGIAVAESQHSQSATWEDQKGRSTRVGSTFSEISPRQISLKIQFYGLNTDVSERCENIMTLQEIDESTGNPGTLLYQEGALKIQPLVVDGAITITKSEPFSKQKGFHLANISIPLKLLGGKTSEHRFAVPLMDTELTIWKKQTSDAEKARSGVEKIATETLADCLSEKENQQLTGLMKDKKLNDPKAVAGLSDSAFAQAAIGGLIPADVLQQNKQKLSEALAHQIAAGTNGIGNQIGSMKSAILGQAGTPLSPDLQGSVSKLKGHHAVILDAALEQKLSPKDPVFSDPAVASTLINSVKCGVRLLNQGSPPKSSTAATTSANARDEFFKKELKENAGDSIAQDRLITDRLNAFIGDPKTKDEDIQKLLGLKTKEEVKAIKNAKPFKNKDDFVSRLGSNTAIVGIKSWESFIDSQAAKK